MTTRKTKAERIAIVQERKQQLEKEIKRLQQAQRADERDERDKRYCRRGKHIESLVDGSPDMTDEQFYKIIAKALNKHFLTKRADTAPPPSGADESKDEGAVPLLEH